MSVLRCLAFSLLFACVASMAAGDPKVNEKLTLGELSPGKLVSGESLTTKDLKGKVVYVVYWGTKCGACMAEMPHWEAMYKKFHSEGLEMIGIERGSPEAEVLATARNKGVDFTVTSNGDLKGADTGGFIPHGFLFGADGKVALDNPHGAELEKKIASLLKEAPGVMAGPGPYVKLAPLAAQVKSGIGLGNVLKQLATKKTSKDAAEAAEATTMYDTLHGSLQEQYDLAVEKKTSAPLVAITKLNKLAAQFSGDELAKKAADEAAAMLKQPAIKKEIEGAAVWKQIQAATEKLKPGTKGSKDPADESFRKLNMEALAGIVNGSRGIVKNYPGTAAAAKAQELIDQYTAPAAAPAAAK